MSKLAVLFAGQGSQYSGMGIDFLEADSTLKHYIKQADERLGYSSYDVLTSTDGRLNETKYTQPMMFLTSVLAFESFKKLNPDIQGVAGFSLGEYNAFYASEIYDFNQLIELVSKRASWMDEAANKTKGSMAAIIGLSSEKVDALCQNIIDGVVVPANYNSPIQTVVSGDEHAVDALIELAKSEGAKRAIKLNVSGAFHSPLMQEAGINLFNYVNTCPKQKNTLPLYMNTTAKPLVFNELEEQMKRHVFSPVQFVKLIEQMVHDGYTHFIEIGAGTVLSGLVKKINLDLEVTNLGKVTDLDHVKGWLETHGFIK